MTERDRETERERKREREREREKIKGKVNLCDYNVILNNSFSCFDS